MLKLSLQRKICCMNLRTSYILLSICYFIISLDLFAQTDTSKSISLKDVEIIYRPELNQIERKKEIEGTIIYSGKKNEIIKLGNIDADLSVNNSRQVFGKVPGVSVWENDGSGIQTGISTRGLSPNRSWEFNVRQNGYDISGDVFGYPEAYYTPPLEAIDRVEIIRGAGALQYGPQFGGMLNYVFKKGNSNKPVTYETQQTVGSFGLFNSYNAIGGTYKKFSYYAFFHHRNADSWRRNNHYTINTGYASFTYSFTSKLTANLQLTSMDFVSQQPGGLTDSLFKVDPKQSLRNRNWMSAPWKIAALDVDYQFSENTKLNLKAFGLYAQRNSVGYVASITTKDTFNNAIKSYNPRQVDRDTYLSGGAELRFIHQYQFLNQKNAISVGIRYYNGSTDRMQLGKGTADANFDLNLTQDYTRKLNYTTNNMSLFAEHLFKLGKRLSITPGVRAESIINVNNGNINTSLVNNTGEFNNQSKRKFLLLGVGAQYEISKTINMYANYTQNYRPVLFSDLTPSSTTEVIDKNLKDASGYNVDAGIRGTVKQFLNFDIGAFYLHYDNRIGTITDNGLPFKTNIGTSVSKGVESYVELDLFGIIESTKKLGKLNAYASVAFIDAQYTQWNNPLIVNDPLKTRVGKKVENAPESIQRYGVTYIYKTFSITYQINSVSAVFSDADNTEKANSTATNGLIPAYTIMDASLSYSFAKKYNVKAGVNNLANVSYFTRRSGGYPGPGLMPGNGRTLFLGLGCKF